MTVEGTLPSKQLKSDPQENVQPCQPRIKKVSSAGCILIFCHKQLSLKLQVKDYNVCCLLLSCRQWNFGLVDLDMSLFLSTSCISLHFPLSEYCYQMLKVVNLQQVTCISFPFFSPHQGQLLEM